MSGGLPPRPARAQVSRGAPRSKEEPPFASEAPVRASQRGGVWRSRAVEEEAATTQVSRGGAPSSSAAAEEAPRMSPLVSGSVGSYNRRDGAAGRPLGESRPPQS